MKKPQQLNFTTGKVAGYILLATFITGTHFGFSQKNNEWALEKMPVEVETEFALSSLPPHIRPEATVYLLDPSKGYYVSRQGSNGFICFVIRTEWERGVFRQDLATPISFDAEGAKSIFPVNLDVEVMRASGKYNALQIKQIIADRFKEGIYKAPARPGISYMLAPIMRTYDGSTNNVVTMVLPHYMFYAPYLTEADIGGNSPSGEGVFLLGDGKSPHQFVIVVAGHTERARIVEEYKDLLERLVAYKPYLKPDHGMHH